MIRGCDRLVKMEKSKRDGMIQLIEKMTNLKITINYVG